MEQSKSNPARVDIKEPVKSEGWFATFTLLDVGGAVHSSQLRRLGTATIKIWNLTLRGVSSALLAAERHVVRRIGI